MIEAYRGGDPDGFYHTTQVALVAIAYNTKLVKPEDAPKNWPDLLDPKWKNQVSVSHPGFSGRVGNWVVAMRKLYGWEYFEKLEKNKPQIGRSIVDTVTMLNAGERMVSASSVNSVRPSIARGNPLAIVYPTDGALLMEDPSAILANTKNPNAAKLFMEFRVDCNYVRFLLWFHSLWSLHCFTAESKLFMEFLLGVEKSRIAVAAASETMRPEVELPADQPRIGEVKTFKLPLQEVVDGIPEVTEKWRDLFGV